MHHRRPFVVLLGFVLVLVGTVLAAGAPPAAQAATNGKYDPFVPSRLLDTRAPRATVDWKSSGQGLRGPQQVTVVQVRGRGGVAGNAVAAMLNLTVVDARSSGYATLYPCGNRPNASTVNYRAGDTIANGILARLDSNGRVCIYNHGRSHLLLDVSGSVPSGSSYRGLRPARLLETRARYTTVDGVSAKIGLRRAASVTAVKVAGRGGVPANARSAVVNLTVVGARGAGYATVYPCGDRPNASTVNYAPGDTIANGVITQLDARGRACIYTHRQAHLLLDVSGTLPDSMGYRGLRPVRLLETRTQYTTVDGAFAKIGQRRAGSVTTVKVAGRGGVPANARTAIVNLTVVGASGNGYAAIRPCGTVSTASTINYRAGDTIANGVITQLDAQGRACIYTHRAAHLLLDVSGTLPAAKFVSGPAGCGLSAAAFCADFEGGRNQVGNRNGDLSVDQFSVSRWRPGIRGEAGYVGPAQIGACRSGVGANPLPPRDVLVCDPAATIATRHAYIATAEQNYGDTVARITRPFDFAGRTGKIRFDTTLATNVGLTGWPTLVVSSLPYSAPQHTADNTRGATVREGVAVHFNDECNAGGQWNPSPTVYAYHDHREVELTNQAPCTRVGFGGERLNRVEVRLSTSRIEVWISDASNDGINYGTLRRAFSAPLDLSFTRGHVHVGVHNHATIKYENLPSWNVRWDNIAFDGPVIAADRVAQVPNATTPSGPGVEIAYRIPANGTTPALQVPAVVTTGTTSARLLFNLMVNTDANPPSGIRIRYRINDNTWRQLQLDPAELAVANERASTFTFSRTIPHSDLRNGTNTIRFAGTGISQSGYQPFIANIDLTTR